MKILYCTNEPSNPVDKIEISRLREFCEVTIICPLGATTDEEAGNVITIQSKKSAIKISDIWMKFCALICRMPFSRIAFRYPERNIYYNSDILKTIVNLIWNVKKINFINKFLPKFSSLVFYFPYPAKDLENKSDEFIADIVIYNSLLIMSAPFLPLLKQLGARGVKRIANVRSWDNPYYIQFDTGADGYLVWSDFMAEIMRKSQNMAASAYYCWGPNILKNFNESPICKELQYSKLDGFLYIGYAAAFGDSVVTYAEYRFICELATALNNGGVKCKILYRPYPTVSVADLLDEMDHDNVVICGIDSLPIDRFGDGRETIRFGSSEERKVFLSSCTYFLSLGTTFTLEALIHGSSIVHLFIPVELRKSSDEHLVFNRIEITCDHFFDYFTDSINFSESVEELLEIFKISGNKNHEFDTLRNRIGLDNLKKPIIFQQ